MAIKQPDVSALFNTHSAWKNGTKDDLLEFGAPMFGFSFFGTSGIMSGRTGLALVRDGRKSSGGVRARDEVSFGR